MKLTRLLLALGFCAALCAAQTGVRYDVVISTVTGASGSMQQMIALPNTQIYVCSGVYSSTACTAANETTVYSNSTLTTAIVQPIATDATGSFGFWASAGQYFFTGTPPVGSGGSVFTQQITLGAGSLSAYETVEQSGTALTQRNTLNFTGSAVSCADNSGSARTDCTITAGTEDNLHFNSTLTGGPVTPYPWQATPFALAISAAPTPAAPVVTTTGPAQTNYSYQVVELSGVGNTAASGSTSISGPTTLSSSNYNTITGTCAAESDEQQFYVGGDFIGTAACTGSGTGPFTAVLKDTGQSRGGGIEAATTSGAISAPAIFLGTGPTFNQGNPVFSGPGNIWFPSSGDGSIGVFGGSEPVGMQFAQSELSLGPINFSGTVSAPLMEIQGAGVIWFPGAWIGLGGGLGGSVSMGQWTFTQTNGTNINTVLTSTNSSGGTFGQDVQAPIESLFVVPSASASVSVPVPGTGSNLMTCSSTNLNPCTNAGMYAVRVYVQDTASCATPGPAQVSVSVDYTDAHGARTMPIPLQQLSGTTATSLGLGTGTNVGSGFAIVWNASGNNIEISSTATQCTAGSGAATVYGEIRRLN